MDPQMAALSCAGPQVIILNGMVPQGPLFLVRAGHQVIVVEPTDPQLIAPHGADPRVIIPNGMNISGRFFLCWSSSDHAQQDGSSRTARSCAGHQVIVVEPTDPQLIAPHGADPRVIILNGMDPQVAALSCAGPQVII